MAIEIIDFKLLAKPGKIVDSTWGEAYAPSSLAVKRENFEEEDSGSINIKIENPLPATAVKQPKSNMKQSKPIVAFESDRVPVGNNRPNGQGQEVPVLPHSSRRQESFHFAPMEEEELETVEEEAIKRFEKVTDLYVDFSGWEILVRVIGKNYREFTNKNKK